MTNLVSTGKVPPDKNGDRLALPSPEDPARSLLHFAELYLVLQVKSRSPNTERAQKRDLELFLGWFSRSFGHLRAEQWLRATTEEFVRWLRTSAKPAVARAAASPQGSLDLGLAAPAPKRTAGTGYSVATVNRTLATLRTFASFCQRQGACPYGHATEGVPDLMKDKERPKSLSRLQMNRLRQAAQVLCQIKRGENQYPARDFAILMVLYRVGLRVAELCGLERSQLDTRGNALWLTDIKRKGKRVDDRPIPSDARAALEAYLAEERPHLAEKHGARPPLFLSSGGRPLDQKAVWNLLERIAAQANATLPAEERIRVTPHQLRHTFAQEYYDRFGDVETARALGHTSLAYVSVYNKRTDDEEAAMVEKLVG